MTLPSTTWVRGRSTLGRENGFTLIELLMVIVIVAILAGVVVLAVQDLSGQSAVASCQSDFTTVESAMEAYKAQMGGYPGGTYNPGTVLTAATGPEPGNSGGVLDLLGTATSANGSAGPWLRDYPYSAGHYQIEVSTDGKGTVSVYDTASPAMQVPSSAATDTGTDCTNVR